MSTQLENYALITGATSGIGYELAKLFAANKYNLVLVARHQKDLDEKAAEFRKNNGIEVVTISRDLFEYRAAFEVHDLVKAKGLQVTVLVNDAGQGEYGLFLDTNLEKELEIIQLNVMSLVVLTKLFARDMATAGGGKILNLSSIASKSPGPWQSVYHGTKAFVQSFSEALHVELKEKYIVVTALLPGVTDTDFFNKAHMQDSKIAQDKDSMADPADVARDGYEALMAGKDMVVSGMKNKFEVMMDSVTPDKKLSEKMYKGQEPD